MDRSSEIWSSDMDLDDDDDDSELPARRVRDLRLLDILNPDYIYRISS